MNRLTIALMTSTLWVQFGVAAAGFIARGGKPAAEIIVSQTPTRSQKLAARELRNHVRKISGAELPIVSTPSGDFPVKIYVGESEFTKKLGLNVVGLEHGAFRMVSGEGWLALLGRDDDFVPKEPWPRNRDERDEVIWKKWDALTGETWENPRKTLYKDYNSSLDIWKHDKRGSLNAVHEFLRRLGVRWYLPGPLGEVVPKTKTIAFPKVNETVKPDFPLRRMAIYGHMFHQASDEETLWQLRLGLNDGGELLGHGPIGHGMCWAHGRSEIHEAHPEYFKLSTSRAIYDTAGRSKFGKPCMSSEELFKLHVNYARTVFDVYDDAMVSVSPADGYTGLCRCPLCKGKDTPERGFNGKLSDYVWGYVDRIARELYKSHPDKKLICSAYSTYLKPPEGVVEFSPNVVVKICQWRSLFDDPETRERQLKLRRDWLEKLPSKQLLIQDYYLHARLNRPWEGIPAVFPHLTAEDLKTLKGNSLGDFIEVCREPRNSTFNLLATNHLNVYVTSRLLWDADQDVDVILDEYYEKFYGPAKKEMKAFFEHCEKNWRRMRSEAPVIVEALRLLAAARLKAGGGVHGDRVEFIENYHSPLLLNRLKNLLVVNAKGKNVPRRENPPVALVGERDGANLILDGKLDDELWNDLPTYRMRELITGKEPETNTEFKIALIGDDLVFGVRCDEPKMADVVIGATENGDPGVWMGDVLDLLLETHVHSYYQIAVNPAEALTDADRKGGKVETRWKSHSKAAVHRDEDFWSAEIRIPLAGEMAEDYDRFGGVAGWKPTEAKPWYFNLCRKRVGGGGELSAFSPTGKKSFHELDKFAKLIVGRPKK